MSRFGLPTCGVEDGLLVGGTTADPDGVACEAWALAVAVLGGGALVAVELGVAIRVGNCEFGDGDGDVGAVASCAECGRFTCVTSITPPMTSAASTMPETVCAMMA